MLSDARPEARHSSRWRLSTDGQAAAAVAMLLLGVYLLTMGGHTYSVDGETYLAGTRALLHATTVIEPGSDLDAVVVLVPNKNGDMTTVAPIGTLLLFTPALILGKVLAAPFGLQHQEEIVRLVFLSANSVMTAITGALLFLLCRQLGARRPSAVLLAMTYGLGTWAWAHAQTDFSEPGTAMMLTAALLASTRWWQRPGDRSAAALVGFLAGVAGITRSTTLLFVPILLLAGILHKKPNRRLTDVLWFGIGGIVPGTLFAVNAWIRFGSPLDSGYPPLPFSTPFYEGLYGLIASPGKGIIFYAPVCLVVIFAARTSFLANRRYALTVAALLSAHVAVFARFVVWSGENAFGPRYLAPVLPIVVALLAPMIDSAPQWIRGVRVAGAVGFLIPGLLGSVMYFNAVYSLQQPGLLKDLEVSEVTTAQQYLAWNFYPRTSPLILQATSVPDLVRNTFDRIDGGADHLTPIPVAYEDRIHWHARSVDLDTWWAWWSVKNGPEVLYLLLLFPLALLVAGVRIGRRAFRDDTDARTDDTNNIVEHTPTAVVA